MIEYIKHLIERRALGAATIYMEWLIKDAYNLTIQAAELQADCARLRTERDKADCECANALNERDEKQEHIENLCTLAGTAEEMEVLRSHVKKLRGALSAILHSKQVLDNTPGGGGTDIVLQCDMLNGWRRTFSAGALFDVQELLDETKEA